MGIIFTGQPVKWCLPCIALFGKIARYCSLASLTLAVKLCAKDYIMPDYSPMHRRYI